MNTDDVGRELVSAQSESVRRIICTMVRPERRRVVLVGESPVRVSAGAPGSRLQQSGEIRPREAECQKPLKERGAKQRAATKGERYSLVKLSAERCLGGPSHACHGEGNRQHSVKPDGMLDLLGVSGPLIGGRHLENVAITGRGVLTSDNAEWLKLMPRQKAAGGDPGSANGPNWQRLLELLEIHTPAPREAYLAAAPELRPSFVRTMDSHNVLIEGVRFTGSPMWTIHLLYTDNAVVRDVTIETYPGGQNRTSEER